MNVFQMREKAVGDYRRYIESFVRVRDNKMQAGASPRSLLEMEQRFDALVCFRLSAAGRCLLEATLPPRDPIKLLQQAAEGVAGSTLAVGE